MLRRRHGDERLSPRLEAFPLKLSQAKFGHDHVAVRTQAGGGVPAAKVGTIRDSTPPWP